MTDRLETDIRRGDRARQLIDDELFTEAFETLRRAYVDAFFKSLPDQFEKREQIYLAMGTLRSVQANLETIINTGALAHDHLDYLSGQRADKE